VQKNRLFKNLLDFSLKDSEIVRCTIHKKIPIYRNFMKQLTILLLLLTIGCKNNADLTMERGIQYYEWNLVDKAILEFNQVVHMFPKDSRSLDYNQVQLLSQAHHNLAVAYSKKEWFTDAEREARTAFELVPSSENKRVLDLIKDKSL